MIRQRRVGGQAILEFVLVIPLLLGLLLVLFDLGRITYYYSAINNAAREGARYGIIYKDNPTDIQTVAENAAVGVTGGIVSAVVNVTDPPPPADRIVTVTVSFTYVPATPFVGNLIGGGPGITISSQAQMVAE